MIYHFKYETFSGKVILERLGEHYNLVREDRVECFTPDS